MNNLPKIRAAKCFLLDMDGTFYLGSKLLPGALELLDLFDRREIAYLFLTNNSSKTPREYVEKLRGLGAKISEDKIFTSGEATAIYLKRQKPGARLYVVGTPALEAAFRADGFQLTADNPDFAVLGFDTTLTYEKIRKLCDLVSAGVPYIATHPDINCPTEDGFMPDAGAMMAMIAASTGKQPDVIIGKPHAPIVAALTTRMNLPIEAFCMVGDRLYTDIALGKNGLTTVLVLSGETKPADLLDAPYTPDAIFDNLSGLAAALQSSRLS